MYLVYDTETTGKPKSHGAPADLLDNWPRMTQLAWKLYDENKRVARAGCFLIKPDGWEIPKEPFFTDNGMTTERCAQFGIDVESALMDFAEAEKLAKYRIAHNKSFDSKIIRSEIIRASQGENKWFWESTNTKFESLHFCTMLGKGVSDFMKQKTGNGRWPKLESLYQACFGRSFSGAHDAGVDLNACALCFFYLLDNNFIQLPIAEEPQQTEQIQTTNE